MGRVPLIAAGCWPVEAVGTMIVLRSVKITDGRSTWSVDCDYLACGFGLVANLELPSLLGCDPGGAGPSWTIGSGLRLPESSCAGEATGIGGLDLALLEGRIAGLERRWPGPRGEPATFEARDKARQVRR